MSDKAKSFFSELKTLLAKHTGSVQLIKTKDGKELSHPEGMEIGKPCLMDGKPAPDGEYELENGMVHVVKEGKIVDMKQPKKEEEMTAEQLAEEIGKAIDAKMAVVKSDFDKQMADLKTSFESLKGVGEKFDATAKELKDEISKEATFSKEVMALLEKIPAPAAAPKPNDKPQATDFATEMKMWKEKYINKQ